MRVFGEQDSYLYNKKGFNMSILARGSSVNMIQVYQYTKKLKIRPSELTKQEYLMFQK